MNAQVIVVHADEQPDITEWAASIFLAGPMPRDISVPSWRPAMLEAITNAWTGPGTLTVFMPEARNWQPLKYDHHHWEDRWLSVVDVIVFWVPRDMQRLPGMNTNIEFGRWESSGRFVFGAPPSAAGVGYLRECAARQGAPVAGSMEQTIADALAMIDGGQFRSAGNCDVPLLLWRCARFQEWLETQIRAGRKLCGGRLLWVHGIDPKGCPLYWAFRAEFEGDDAAQIVLGTPQKSNVHSGGAVSEQGRIFRQAWIAGVNKHYPGTPKDSYVTPWEDTPEWERASASAVYDQVKQFVELGATGHLSREQKGRFVALCWIAQIFKHIPNPKPGYVADWDALPEWQKETDSDIFEHIEAALKGNA